MKKFTDILKEDLQNQIEENEIITSFVAALKSLPMSDSSEKFESLQQTVKEKLDVLSDDIDKIEFDIQNINNSLAQEVLNQKEKERDLKIKEREKIHKVEQALNKILPAMKTFLNFVDGVKREFNVTDQ